MTEIANTDRKRRFGHALVATRRRRIVAGITAATLVLVGCGGAVYASTHFGGETYRTAISEHSDVSQSLVLTGQLAEATSRDVAFQVGGTVDSVLVKLGQTVTAGQQLATLDAEVLDAAVTDVEDELAQAQQQLEDDLETQQNGGSSSAGTSTGAAPSSAAPSGKPSGEAAPGAPSTPTTPDAGTDPGTGTGTDHGTGDEPEETPETGDTGTATDPAVTAAIAAVADAQQALLAQYELAAQAQTASGQTLTTAQEVCAPFLDASLVVDQPAASSDTDAAPAPATSNADDLKQQLADCQSALADTQTAQSSTTAEQSALTDRATALDDAVTALQQAIAAASSDAADLDAAGAADPDGAEPSASPSAATSSFSGTGSASIVTAAVVHPSTVQTTAVRIVASTTPSPSGSGGSSSVTAETILADRADIAAAEASLAVAQRDRTLAALTSPIAGTVVSVGMASGDTVAAGSAEAAIRVQGGDGYIVELSVPLAQIAGVAVGQSATADLAAFGASYDASVSSVGIANVSETSTPSYTVTVALDADVTAEDADTQPHIGATTRVTITLATAKDVLTVPISAISRDGSSASVIVLSDAGIQTVPVELGAVGSERVEITDGLSEGDRVVIADLGQPVGDEGSSSTSGLSGLGGGGSSTRGGSEGFQPPAGFQPPGS